MRTVLEWPQSDATCKTINMITNKYEPQQKCCLGTVSKKKRDFKLAANTAPEKTWQISYLEVYIKINLQTGDVKISNIGYQMVTRLRIKKRLCETPWYK